MPFAIDPLVPFTVGATIVDNNGNRGNVSVNVPSALNAAELAAWTVALGAALENLSDGYVEKVYQTIVYAQTGVNALNPTSEVERKLFIPLRGAGNIRGSITVPSPLFSLEQDGTDNVNIANAAYLAFIALLLNGTPGAENGAVSFTGGQFTALANRPYVTHRTRKRRP